jgi:hypothetical protein
MPPMRFVKQSATFEAHRHKELADRRFTTQEFDSEMPVPSLHRSTAYQATRVKPSSTGPVFCI